MLRPTEHYLCITLLRSSSRSLRLHIPMIDGNYGLILLVVMQMDWE